MMVIQHASLIKAKFKYALNTYAYVYIQLLATLEESCPQSKLEGVNAESITAALTGQIDTSALEAAAGAVDEYDQANNQVQTAKQTNDRANKQTNQQTNQLANKQTN
jgi:hypothetical protein